MPDPTQSTGVPTSPAEYYETQYCHSCCILFRHFLLLTSDVFEVKADPHLASHLFPAVPRGVLSSLLLGPVLYCPHSRSLGKCPARRYRFSVILQVSTKTFRLSSTGQLDNRGWKPSNRCGRRICIQCTHRSIDKLHMAPFTPR